MEIARSSPQKPVLGQIKRIRNVVFEEVSPGSVDLLKMDIKGTEYALDYDERFGKLGARLWVIEWHERKSRPAETRTRLIGRLQGYGHQVRDGREAQQVGKNLRVGMI